MGVSEKLNLPPENFSKRIFGLNQFEGKESKNDSVVQKEDCF